MPEDLRIAHLEAQLAEVRSALPRLADAVHAAAAQVGTNAMQAAAFDREIARIARAVDGPPHLDAMRVGITRLENAEADREVGGSTPAPGASYPIPSGAFVRGFNGVTSRGLLSFVIVVLVFVLGYKLYGCTPDDLVRLHRLTQAQVDSTARAAAAGVPAEPSGQAIVVPDSVVADSMRLYQNLR